MRSSSSFVLALGAVAAISAPCRRPATSVRGGHADAAGRPEYWPSDEPWPAKDGPVEYQEDSMPPNYVLRSGRTVPGRMAPGALRTRDAAAKELDAVDDILSYGGAHQDQLQGLLDVLATQEVRESLSDVEETMSMQSRTGVIYATSRAKRWGFKGAGDPDWGNLGQGAPETGPLAGAPARDMAVVLDDEANEYGDVNGRLDLRAAVADYYNHWFRRGKTSKYTAANVAIVPGGRAGLSRLMASLHNCNVGYFLPDYTAYQQLLGEFVGVSPIAVAHDVNGVATSPAHLRSQIRLHGLGAFLLSNPCNPTGEPVAGDALRAYVDVARRENTMMLMDEFYSHYVYEGDAAGRPFRTLSAAEFVDDVDSDPVVLVNGFTKNWRLPGWRCCWVVGPRHCIDVLGSIGSFMDGGPNNPLQKAAAPLLAPDFVEKDALALQAHFREKRDFLVAELAALGITCETPKATFYIWADVARLPPPLNNCVVFFEYCVRHKVICVPGIFFDVNPFHRRRFHKSPYISKLRMSFGPAWPNLRQAVRGMKEIVALARAGKLPPLEDAPAP